VLGGFSMGTVMSYALGEDADRPAPAGILAFSGFVPVVDGWAPDLESRQGLRAFVAHGRRDPIMDVAFARRVRELLEAGGPASSTTNPTSRTHSIRRTSRPPARDSPRYCARAIEGRSRAGSVKTQRPGGRAPSTARTRKAVGSNPVALR